MSMAGTTVQTVRTVRIPVVTGDSWISNRPKTVRAFRPESS